MGARQQPAKQECCGLQVKCSCCHTASVSTERGFRQIVPCCLRGTVSIILSLLVGSNRKVQQGNASDTEAADPSCPLRRRHGR